MHVAWNLWWLQRNFACGYISVFLSFWFCFWQAHQALPSLQKHPMKASCGSMQPIGGKNQDGNAGWFDFVFFLRKLGRISVNQPASELPKAPHESKLCPMHQLVTKTSKNPAENAGSLTLIFFAEFWPTQSPQCYFVLAPGNVLKRCHWAPQCWSQSAGWFDFVFFLHNFPANTITAMLFCQHSGTNEKLSRKCALNFGELFKKCPSKILIFGRLTRASKPPWES